MRTETTKENDKMSFEEMKTQNAKNNEKNDIL